MPEQKVSTTARWGETAESYKFHVDRVTRVGAAVLVSMADSLRSMDSSAYVLDNGAGAGAVTACIVSKHPSARVLAADINQQMLDVIDIASPRLEKRRIDARTLSTDLPPNTFSHVLCSFVLHVITTPLDCLREMEKVLQHDPTPGVIGVSVWGLDMFHLKVWTRAVRPIQPDYQLPQLADDATAWRTEGELIENLSKAGFQDIQTATTQMPWPFASAEAYADFWFGVSGPNPIAEGCTKSVDPAILPRVRIELERIVREEYGNGVDISEPAVLAVASTRKVN